MSKRIYYSWPNFNDAMEVIASRVRAEGHLQRIKRIYGISRGGLVMAVKLSHRLGLPLATLEDVMVYGHTLIVDDISDSGETLKRVGKLAICTATIHMVPGTVFKPDIWVEEKARDTWIVYPWEV